MEQGRGGGDRRAAAWLAWSLCAVCFALIGLALLLDFLTGEVIPADVPGERPGLGFAVLTGVLSLAFPMVGALIASRLPSARPREVLGNEMQCAHELAERSREASSQGSQNLPIHCPGGRLIMH